MRSQWGEAEKGLAAGMLAALASRNFTGPDAEAFLAEVMKFYNHVKSGAGASAGQGHVAAGGLQTEANPAPTPQPLPLRIPPVEQGGGRGRSATPKEDKPPREKSSSRTPRGSRKDGQ